MKAVSFWHWADYKSYTQLNYVALRYFNAAGASKELGENHRVETVLSH